MLARGEAARARERFAEIVSLQQQRASRIAFHYLRDVADADEAVQDAFVKAFTHLPSYREELPFAVWFTRILINGCLDRLKARGRRARWMVPLLDTRTEARDEAESAVATTLSPEETMLIRERRRQIALAVRRLPERQRTVFILSHYDGRSAREVGAITGLNESTVRVHLFRAIRRLRALLAGDRPAMAALPSRTEGDCLELQ